MAGKGIGCLSEALGALRISAPKVCVSALSFLRWGHWLTCGIAGDNDRLQQTVYTINGYRGTGKRHHEISVQCAVLDAVLEPEYGDLTRPS